MKENNRSQHPDDPAQWAEDAPATFHSQTVGARGPGDGEVFTGKYSSESPGGLDPCFSGNERK
ncbi:hypothetical protein BCE02nite_05100 [Brevibacillus centrosporus]|nr:hypothetical protein BCE02nite_05100 [Brevibacillus centrosporus]